MKRWIPLLALVALTWGLAGCGKSNEVGKDAEGKALKAPEVPPNGP